MHRSIADVIASTRRRVRFCQTKDEMKALERANAPTRDDLGTRSLWSEVVAGLEWAALKVSPVYYGFGVPRGDGSPVILVPGLLASDLSLAEMHLWLGRIGYRSYASGIGRNTECPDVLLERLLETVARVHQETGQRVRLIGHSMGGLLARAAAGQAPEHVAQLITLGTPLRRIGAHPTVFALARKVMRRSRRRTGGPCLRSFKAGLTQCLPEPLSHAAICSKSDPVVNWDDCAGVDGAVDIEVGSTHIGMPANPQVYLQVAKLLASPEQLRTPLSIQPADQAALPLAA